MEFLKDHPVHVTSTYIIHRATTTIIIINNSCKVVVLKRIKNTDMFGFRSASERNKTYGDPQKTCFFTLPKTLRVRCRAPLCKSLNNNNYQCTACAVSTIVDIVILIIVIIKMPFKRAYTHCR